MFWHPEEEDWSSRARPASEVVFPFAGLQHYRCQANASKERACSEQNSWQPRLLCKWPHQAACTMMQARYRYDCIHRVSRLASSTHPFRP
jgi:hypothetical protein